MDNMCTKGLHVLKGTNAIKDAKGSTRCRECHRADSRERQRQMRAAAKRLAELEQLGVAPTPLSVNRELAGSTEAKLLEFGD